MSIHIYMSLPGTTKLLHLFVASFFLLASFGPALASSTPAYAGTKKEEPVSKTDPAFSKDCDDDHKKSCDFIGTYINPAIALFTAVFGILAVISIIIGGIQYASSTDDPQKVSKAKQRIINTIIAIVAYFFLYAFLQFLIPGGAFNRETGP